MYGITGLGRFRVSAFRQRGWVGLVLRRVLPGIPGFDALSLPAAVAALADQPHGLVLVSGLAGSGKTATLAAMVDHVNATRECHIVTIEDPVEVLHADKRAVVDQREVGTDTPSAESALVHALRQDPDVIMVSQIRDATVGVGGAAGRRDRTAGAVEPVDRQRGRHRGTVRRHVPAASAASRARLARGRAARGRLATSARTRVGGRGRVPAVEVLVVNVVGRGADRTTRPAAASSNGEMVDGDLYGMQSFDQSLVRLYQGGLVTRADVLAHADEPSEMKFELDRADFERGGAPTYPSPRAAMPSPGRSTSRWLAAAARRASTAMAQHDPGDAARRTASTR